MGFVYTETADTIRPTKRVAAPRRAPRPAQSQERGCNACPLQATWPTLTSPQMRLYAEKPGPEVDVLILGEGPGEEEDRRGRAFVGAAGQLLYRFLPSRQRPRLALTNAVRCRPPGNRTPHAREAHACSVHLEEDIARGEYSVILGLGAAPLARFLPEGTITQAHGLKFPVTLAGRTLWYYPTLHPAAILHTGGDRSPLLPILENDLKAFFKGIDRWPEPEIERPDPAAVIQARDPDTAYRWWAKIRSGGGPVGFDIETTGLRPNAAGADMLTAAVSDGTLTLAWPVHHPEHPPSDDRGPLGWGLKLALEITRTRRWIAHNAGFELAWLYDMAQRHGIDWEPEQGFDDSMVAARLHQRRESCLNLGILTRLYGGVNVKRLAQVNVEALATTPLSEVLPYNGLDAWGCWLVFTRLTRKYDQNNYRAALETIESTVAMQLAGLDVDQTATATLHTEWEARASAAAAHAATVYEVRKYRDATRSEFNLASGDQVGRALTEFGRLDLPKTGKGNYATDDATLTSLAPDNPLVKDVLQYRHAQKIVSTYLKPLSEAATRYRDGRIHPAYSVVLTRTLRLSSEDPNIQNFPKRRDREVRRAVVPPEGCVWASADYGQLEARVYGMATKDRALCESIISQEDIHTYWLDRVLALYPPYLDRLAAKVTPNDTEAQIRKGGRDIIKSDFTFASFYGATAKNVAERTGIPPDIVTGVLGEFWDRYRNAYKWLKARRQEYRDSGVARNLCGLERYGIMTGNEPVNTPIQSTAARLVLEAQNEMFRLARREADPHLMPRINIHDDLTFALPDDTDRLEAYIDEISRVLTKVRFPWQIVPLMVEWKIGANWADLDYVHSHVGDHVR